MLLSIIGIIVGWFVLGFIINFFAYGGKPQHEMGKSDSAKALNNILNIVTVIALIAV
tara:strand:- start:124 stop:294 length:171 start_codon:yes stop_codon:yes gene_type:complete